MLHDVGKIGIADDILNKPAKLSGLGVFFFKAINC